MDNIKNPAHYAKSAIEPIDYITANKLSYCEGNVVKYVTRWKSKGGIEDLQKAKVYIDFIIDKEIVAPSTEDVMLDKAEKDVYF
jgi:hypothetical protein